MNNAPQKIVGVRFKRSGPIHFFDSESLDLQVNDAVVVETEEGSRIGWVAIAPHQVIHNDLRKPLPPIHRRATEEEVATLGRAVARGG